MMLANLAAFVRVLFHDALTAAGLLSADAKPDNKPTKPTPPSGALVPRVYPLLCDAVEAGVAYGWRRAWKHRDDEPDATVASSAREYIADDVVAAICERFSIADDTDR